MEMDKIYGHMAELIFSVLDGSGHNIRMYNESGKEVFEPKDANRLWSDSEKIMVVIGKTKGSTSKPLVTFWTSNVTNPKIFDDFKNAIEAHNIYDFSFDIKPFPDKTLEPRHFKFMDIKESSMWTGTTRTSYFPIDKVNVVIRHNRPWNTEQIDKAQRWRRIKQIMLFTPDGQRFKFPHNHVLGARAMAQHLNHDHGMHDVDGKLIQDLTKLLFDLRTIQFKCKTSQEWALLAHVIDTRHQIRGLLKAISQSHRYTESMDHAKKWIGEWSSKKFVKTPAQELTPSDSELVTSVEAPTFKEARQLQEWFDSFEPKKIFENQEKQEQVQIAWDQSGGDIDQTIDILKRTFPPVWQSEFEEDPKSVRAEVTKIVNSIKNSS